MCNLSYSILLVVILYLVSCKPQPEAAALLKQAESIVETYPDSAMLLIDSLFYPEKSLKRNAYMRFLVTQVQAKYKTHHPINEDTLIFHACDFFSKYNKEPRITALAYFYSGCVKREREEYDEAMLHYSKAGEYAIQTSDFALQGLVQYNMGDLFTKQGVHEKALEHYMIAAQLNVSEPGKQALCFSAMGRMFAILQQPDSAFWYFHKGLEIAETTNNTELQSLLAQNLSVEYTNSNQFEIAEKYLRQSFSLNTDSTEIPRYYLNFSELYAGMGQQDSVAIYREQLKRFMDNSNIDKSLEASIYRFLAASEKEKGDFNAAFDYQNRYTMIVEEITEERLQQSLFEIQRKFDYEKMKTLHERQVIVFQYWIIILLLAIMVGGWFISWYMFQQRKKHAYTQLQIETLREIAATLNKEYETKLSTKDHDLRELLQWKIDIIKKSVLLIEHSKSKLNAAEMIRIFQQILYQGNKSGHWHNILSVFNQMNKRIEENIKCFFPGLSETEFRIVLLTYAGMSVREISVILNLSPNTVQSYRSKLRKKMGIDDCTIDLEIYLKERLDNA